VFLFRNASNTPLPPVHTGERPIRSLAKAISWRITGSLDTMLLSWFFTRDMKIAAAIGLTEVLTKMVLYYVHERIWNRVSLGRAVEGASVVVATESPATDASTVQPTERPLPHTA